MVLIFCSLGSFVLDAGGPKKTKAATLIEFAAQGFVMQSAEVSSSSAEVSPPRPLLSTSSGTEKRRTPWTTETSPLRYTRRAKLCKRLPQEIFF
jgi:hypothetical protein